MMNNEIQEIIDKANYYKQFSGPSRQNDIMQLIERLGKICRDLEGRLSKCETNIAIKF